MQAWRWINLEAGCPPGGGRIFFLPEVRPANQTWANRNCCASIAASRSVGYIAKSLMALGCRIYCR